MPAAPDNHDAHDYAERIRERLPRRLQELREACGLSMYALWMKCGVSRDMINRIEGGESISKLHAAVRLCKPRPEVWSISQIFISKTPARFLDGGSAFWLSLIL
jgi:DNA-binding XRE family transcriptional regulator